MDERVDRLFHRKLGRGGNSRGNRLCGGSARRGSSAGDTVALAPVAEELEIPTIFTDGCTDHLFDVVVKKPKYVFRVTNILSSDAVSCMVAASRTWPNIKRIAHIHPDYNFGRVQFVHSKIAAEKLYPGSEIVSEGWPKLFAGDYTAHITKAIALGR